jgi:tetratricopeptide (TPR) repeat protein
MKDFFISYNRADRHWAEWIAWQLEASGYSTVIQAWDFRPGGNFVLDMQRAATEAERTIAVLSPDYLTSQFTASEWAAAFAEDPTGEKGLLLLVRVRECEPKGLLSQIVYIDLFGVEEAEAGERLLNGAKRGRAKPSIAPRFPTSASPERAVADKPRFPGALSPVWNVPHQQNPHFVGRDALLDQIHQALASNQAAALTAIHGLGGVGKTTLATEYAYWRASDYDIVWWVRAEETATLAADFSALAAQLNLPEKDARETPVIVEAVRRELNGRTRWLLVFDNARGAEDLRDYLPRGRTGHALITSRNANWGAMARKLEVTTLAPADAVKFLLERARQSDETAAGKLAEALGYLPLALEQAAAYIEAAEETLAGYLDLFRARRQELWPNEKPPAGYPDTVATTWLISFAEAEQQSAAAADLLRLCAFLAPDDIPLQTLRDGAEHLPESLAAATADKLALNKAIAALRRYSLIEKKDDNLSVHRLVQMVTRDRLAQDEQMKWAEAAVKVVNDAFPGESDDVRTWPVCRKLLPHALAAVEQGEALNVAAEATGRLINETGMYFLGRAQYDEAKHSFERSLCIVEAIFGSEHPEVAIRVNNLGLVLQALGKLDEARQCFERALQIDETAFGSEHPEVAVDANNLGEALRNLGKLDEARQCFERALRIDEAAFGSDHPNVAIRVNNLGGALQDLGKLDEARQCYERALELFELHLGKDHPNVATPVNNLGGALQALGKLDEARQCYERSLRIDAAAFGSDHPNVARDANNLGKALQDLGKLDEARQCFERALRICTAFMGDDHPITVTVRNNLKSLG